jgi:hypothetical protein
VYERTGLRGTIYVTNFLIDKILHFVKSGDISYYKNSPYIREPE